MKLSRVYESFEQIPENVREYYKIDDSDRYVLQVSGMIAKKELKKFRDNNIELFNKNKELEEDNKILKADNQKLKEKIQSGIEGGQKDLPEERINSEEYIYFEKLLNTFKKFSILKSNATIENTIDMEEIDHNNFILNGTHIRINGRFIKIGQLRSESYIDLKDPELTIDILRRKNSGIDIFTFIQPITETEVRYDANLEMDNLAAIPITTHEAWWSEQIKDKTRNLVRKAAKNNVTVEKVPLDDDLIRGIHGIFNETPLRQGRPYTHYGKDFDRVKGEISTFRNQSDFIGAYLEDELIGFIKIVYNGRCASLMQILSMLKHRDKAPMNALLSKAVEVCSDNGIELLIYRKFVYGKKGVDELTKFKIHNGFQRFDIPRYYIPLTLKGKIVLFLNLHKNIVELLPTPIYSKLVRLRNYAYEKRSQRKMA